ncbi:MAG: DUF4124 domain-containing protein [Burkholderiales bacterium]
MRVWGFMSMRGPVCLAFLVALPISARAEIYECIDQDGVKRFTNIVAEAKGCRALKISPAHAPRAPASAAPKAQSSRATSAPTPANFPRVDRATQQARDNDRRRILEQELSIEQKLLDQARQELAAQEGTRLGTERNYQRVLDRLEPFQKRVRQHEDNIANLRREISKIR